MKSFQHAAGELEKTSRTVQQVTQQVKAISSTVRAIGDSLQESVGRLRRTARRFGDLGHRAAHLTNGSFEDVRETVRRAQSVMRAARELRGLVFRKVAHHPPSPIRSNGG
jgi:methyl-accepting chemotaxis protein